MFDKEYNRKVVERVMSGPFWETAYDDDFHPDVVFEFPSAPPGMPQYMINIEVDKMRSWLRRTVKSWAIDVEEVYSCPDPGMFFVIRTCSGDVRWGGGHGKFKSKMCTRLELKDGKVIYMREIFDPLAFLEAAGRGVPAFRFDLYDERIEEVIRQEDAERAAAGDAPKAPEPELDMSEEAIAARKQAWIDLLRSNDYSESYKNVVEAPDYRHVVYFGPGEMHTDLTDDEYRRANIWGNFSCQGSHTDPRNPFWYTDDPHVAFVQNYGGCRAYWVGNETTGGYYRNQYFFRIVYDDAGRCRRFEEYLNPINKYNSINVSVPSFPYYF